MTTLTLLIWHCRPWNLFLVRESRSHLSSKLGSVNDIVLRLVSVEYAGVH